MVRGLEVGRTVLEATGCDGRASARTFERRVARRSDNGAVRPTAQGRTMAATYDAEFNIGDVFPAEDRCARLVIRLSMGLGDLRIAGSPLLQDWDETPSYARMYYVRVMTGHISEFMQLIEPEGKTVLPTLEDLLEQFPERRYDESVDAVRSARNELREHLNAQLPVACTTLRREIGRLRNQAFHYGYKGGPDLALRRALTAAANLTGTYQVKPHEHRALFADEVANQLMHPHSGSDEVQMARIEELHRGIAELLGPIARLVMHVEGLWLASCEERLRYARP
jgi:hypothetical protein